MTKYKIGDFVRTNGIETVVKHGGCASCVFENNCSSADRTECVNLIGCDNHFESVKDFTPDSHITVPDGMEIDRENSTLEHIIFKPKVLTYCDIRKKYHFTEMISFDLIHRRKAYVFGQLMEVADFLNNGWKPIWELDLNPKYFIYYLEGKIKVGNCVQSNCAHTYFKSEEDALEAIRIIGEDNLKELFL